MSIAEQNCWHQLSPSSLHSAFQHYESELAWGDLPARSKLISPCPATKGCGISGNRDFHLVLGCKNNPIETIKLVGYEVIEASMANNFERGNTFLELGFFTQKSVASESASLQPLGRRSI